MASQIDICNEALIRLGAPTITSIDDDTKSAKLCKKLYDRVVEQVSGEGSWSNAVSRSTALAADTTDPAFGYDAQYTLPSDCIRVITINDTTPGDYDHRVENNKLLIDGLTSVKIQYIRKLTTPGSFGVFLTNSIIDMLTAKLSYAFTGNASLVRENYAMYKDQLQSNLAADNQQGSRDVIQVRDLLEVR